MDESTKATVYKMLDEADDILQRISDAFGPTDTRYLHAKKQFQDFVVDPTYETVKVGLMYLRWCLQYPNRIGQKSDNKICCGDNNGRRCEGGMILEDAEEGTWIPCSRLLPDTHDNWQKETGFLYN